ncbi:MAG: ribonuclease P protein component [Proteobacteria bacterium]|nr:MAG: ribonuclease P protein component [Pseudomonadota bacterium]
MAVLAATPRAAIPRRYTHGSANRIKKTGDFARLQRSGKKLVSKHFLIVIGPSPTNRARLGVTITRKVDPRAAFRNRLKRRIREIFRLNRHKFSGSFDIIVIARQNAQQCNLFQIRKELLGTLSHAGYLKNASN